MGVVCIGRGEGPGCDWCFGPGDGSGLRPVSMCSQWCWFGPALSFGLD